MSEFLDRAVTAHNLWKSRLRAAIEGGKVPDETEVQADNLCDLGKWIHSRDSAQYQATPEFINLKSKHAQFHAAASEVVRIIKRRDTAKALAELNTGTYAKASTAVVLSIKALKERIKK
jgi:hypothetical protein